MALDFPASPSNGDTYAAPNGVLYTYDAAAGLWYVGAVGSVNTTDIVDGAVTGPKLASDITITTTGNVSAVDGTFSGDLTAGAISGTISGNSADGGAVVGYQSGLWAPDFKGEGGTSWWILNGVSNGSAAETWSSFTWNRIGQTVSVSATIGVKVVGGAADTDALVLTNLPYRSALGNQLGPNTYRPFTETCMTSSFAKATTTYTSISAVVNNMGAASGIYSGEMVYFLWNNLNLAVVPVRANQIAISGQVYFTLQYQTDDTTWIPQNGATVS